MILFSLIGTTLAGSGVVIALVAGYDDVSGILWSASIGAALAVPVSLWVARRIIGES
ncbi:MAG: CTP synthetase [Pseudomonadota bacterium]